MLQIDFKEVSNPREGDGWKYKILKCSKCGVVTNGYIKVTISNECVIVHPFFLCKGCLLKGVDLIDETVLKQSL